MTDVQIYATVCIALNTIVLGILLAEPGQSKTYTYGERWFSWAFSTVACGVLYWMGAA